MKTYNQVTSNAGHSAKSPGASGCGYKEHEQARLLNRAFIKAMEKRGCAVTDTTSDARNKSAVLIEQVAKCNAKKNGPERLDISWHLNYGGGTGTEVYHYGESTREVAARVSSAISKTLGIRDRGSKQNASLYFLSKTVAPAILIEACFIDSEADMQALEGKREQVAEAVALAVTGKALPGQSSVPKSGYTGNSIVDGLKSIGLDASFSNRARLAATYGIVSSANQYTGTAAQNEALLSALRKAGIL
ncbi:MAG: N-acetylmuramoyl-L-alanine amidase [Coriobacteriales bacterium]